jgi:hypothetical protein
LNTFVKLSVNSAKSRPKVSGNKIRIILRFYVHFRFLTEITLRGGRRQKPPERLGKKMRMLQGQDLRINEFNNGFIYQFCRFCEVSSEQRPPAGEAGISEEAIPADRADDVVKRVRQSFVNSNWLLERIMLWHSYLR